LVSATARNVGVPLFVGPFGPEPIVVSGCRPRPVQARAADHHQVTPERPLPFVYRAIHDDEYQSSRPTKPARPSRAVWTQARGHRRLAGYTLVHGRNVGTEHHHRSPPLALSPGSSMTVSFSASEAGAAFVPAGRRARGPGAA
jgi:hypothetical protein